MKIGNAHSSLLVVSALARMETPIVQASMKSLVEDDGKSGGTIAQLPVGPLRALFEKRPGGHLSQSGSRSSSPSDIAVPSRHNEQKEERLNSR